MLFQMLPHEDKMNIDKWISIYSGVDNVHQGTRADLAKILSYWALEKKRLYQMFGGQFIISKDVAFKVPFDTLCEDMDCMIYDHNRGGDFRYALNRMSFDHDKLREHHYDIMQLVAPTVLANNKYEGYSFKIPTPNGKEIQVQSGCKPVKILGKIAAAYEIPGFEEFRLGHSLVLNQKELKGELCLSIHPMDYMTMSDNECDWDSCMSWRNEGCYRRGTLEMMNSPFVIVAYLKAKEDMTWWQPWNGAMDQTVYSWNNKKWRELFVVHPDFITGIKGYPYQNTELEKIIIEWLGELAHKNSGIEYDEGMIEDYMPSTWFSNDNYPNHEWKFSFTTDDMYNDFGTRHHMVKVSKEVLEETGEHYFHVDYSGVHPCLWCGELHGGYEDEGGLVCDTCCNYFYCDCCGERIYGEEEWWLDNNRLCECCYRDSAEHCVISEAEHYENNMTRLYLAVEGVEHFDWRKDPSILISEDDICKSDWEEFFVGGKPHFYCKKEQIAWYREDEYKFVTIEQVTDAGLDLFEWTREEVAEEAAARAEKRAQEELERLQREAEEAKRRAERPEGDMTFSDWSRARQFKVWFNANF